MIGLAEILQALAHQRQDSLIEIEAPYGPVVLVITRGDLCGMHGLPSGGLLRVVVWNGLLSEEILRKKLGPDALDLSDFEIGRSLSKDKTLDVAGLRSALEGLVGEAFCELLSHPGIEWKHLSEFPSDNWLALFGRLNVALPLTGLLMEAARRADEMSEVSANIPDPWDILQTDVNFLRRQTGMEELERQLAQSFATGAVVTEVARCSFIPSWHFRQMLTLLCRQSIVRPTTAAGLISEADRRRNLGNSTSAEHLYRRALVLGADVARIHAVCGELALARGDKVRAASDYLAAGDKLEALYPDQAIKAYTEALQCGADRIHCLSRLRTLHQEAKDQVATIQVTFDLIECLRASGRSAQAAPLLEEAKNLGADPERCFIAQARLAESTNDLELATTCYLEALRLARERHETNVERQVRQALLHIAPSLLLIAEETARDLISSGQRHEAVRILTSAINSPQPHGTFDEMIKCREMYAEMEHDSANTAWLARAYHRRHDQAEGIARLWQVAKRQEDAGDQSGLLETLERIVDLDDSQDASWAQQAKIHFGQGRIRQAQSAWRRGIDAALARDDLIRAQELIDESLAVSPFDLKLQLAKVRCRSRQGDRSGAMEACRIAGNLAAIANELTVAIACSEQILALEPGDIVLHSQLLRLHRLIPHTQRDNKHFEDALRAAIEVARTRRDYGLALEWSAEIIKLLGDEAWTERLTHIDLAALAGDRRELQQSGRSLVVDLIVADDKTRALRLLDRLATEFPGEALFAVHHARLLGEMQRLDELRPSLKRAVAALQQAGEIHRAENLLDEIRVHAPAETLIPELRAALNQGRAVD